MAAYHVSYDLNSPGKDYASLIKAIQRYKSYHALKSYWIVVTNLTLDQLVEDLRTHIDASDHLVVAPAIRPFSGWMPQAFWAWVNANVP